MLNRNLLIVDDEPNIIKSLLRQLKKNGYHIFTAYSGREGLDIIKQQNIGVVMSDQMMPEMSGIQFLEQVKKQRPDIIRLLLTGYASLENTIDAINRSHIFGFLTKPWSFEGLNATLTRAFEHYDLLMENKRLHKLTDQQNKQLKIINTNLDSLVKERTSQLEDAINEGIIMLALAAEAKDNDTGEHVNRIRKMSEELCLKYGLSAVKAEEIGIASIMHDVGKIHVPDKILKKRGPLSEKEWEIMKQHTIAGEKILGNRPFYKTAREIARSHHERWDGTGYPDGLKGKKIPFAARVVSLANVYDALTHKRVYKEAWSKEKTLSEMKSLSGKVFDPNLLELFFSIIGR